MNWILFSKQKKWNGQTAMFSDKKWALFECYLLDRMMLENDFFLAGALDKIVKAPSTPCSLPCVAIILTATGVYII